MMQCVKYLTDDCGSADVCWLWLRPCSVGCKSVSPSLSVCSAPLFLNQKTTTEIVFVFLATKTELTKCFTGRRKGKEKDKEDNTQNQVIKSRESGRKHCF